MLYINEVIRGDRGRFSVSPKKKETENRPLSPPDEYFADVLRMLLLFYGILKDVLD